MPVRLKRTEDGKQFHFQVTARNGRIINPDEPLKNKKDVYKGIDALRNELNKIPLHILDETGQEKRSLKTRNKKKKK